MKKMYPEGVEIVSTEKYEVFCRILHTPHWTFFYDLSCVDKISFCECLYLVDSIYSFMIQRAILRLW